MSKSDSSPSADSPPMILQIAVIVRSSNILPCRTAANYYSKAKSNDYSQIELRLPDIAALALLWAVSNVFVLGCYAQDAV